MHGAHYRVRFKSVGDLKWRSEQLKGQLAHNFTHFDSCIPAITMANKTFLHTLNLSESSLNTYQKRVDAKRGLDALYERESKRLPANATDTAKHNLKLKLLKRLFGCADGRLFVFVLLLLLNVCRTWIGLEHSQIDWPLLLCDDDLPDVLHRLLRLSEQLLHDLMLEAQQRSAGQSPATQSNCMEQLADAIESKVFQGAFTKVYSNVCLLPHFLH